MKLLSRETVGNDKASALNVREWGEGARLFTNASNLALIGLASNQCFSLPWPTRTKTAEESLHYQLESEVPLDAESMSSELCPVPLCPVPAGLVVLTDGAHVAKTLNAEEFSSTKWMAVTPLALLAVQPFVNPRIEHQFFAVSLDGHVDLLCFERGRLREWQWVKATRETVTESFQSMVTDGESTEVNVVCDASDELVEWLSAVVPAAKSRGETDRSLRMQAAKILDGTELPLVNLRNGPLKVVDPLWPARRFQALATSAAIALLGLLALGLFWRAHQYQVQTVELVEKQEAIFKEIFPKQAIPIGIVSRIESEHRRLAATKGTAGAGVPDLGNVLPVMQAFWEAAPTEIRYRVDMMHFTPKLIRKLDGNARNYEDLDVLRDELLLRGFDVPPISSTQSSQGVSLQLDQIPWEPREKQVSNE